MIQERVQRWRPYETLNVSDFNGIIKVRKEVISRFKAEYLSSVCHYDQCTAYSLREAVV